MNNIPLKEVEYRSNGLYFKTGIHGFLYVWVNGEWIRSTSTAPEVAVETNPRLKALGRQG